MKFFAFSFILFTAGCSFSNPFDQSHQDCAQKAVEDNVGPATQRENLRRFSLERFSKQISHDVLHCWFQPHSQLATAEPSSEPVEVTLDELPSDARPADWIEMPGYAVYYTVKTDGSGYNYWKVKTDPADV